MASGRVMHRVFVQAVNELVGKADGKDKLLATIQVRAWTRAPASSAITAGPPPLLLFASSRALMVANCSRMAPASHTMHTQHALPLRC